MPGAWCTHNELSERGRGTRRLNTRADMNLGPSSKILLVTEGMFGEEINRTVRKVREGCPKVTAHTEPPP